MADPRNPLGPVLPPHMLGQASGFTVPQQQGEQANILSALLSAIEGRLEGPMALQQQAAADQTAMAQAAGQSAAEWWADPAVQAWAAPFIDNPSRLIGGLISGQNPLAGDRSSATLDAPTVSEALLARGAHPALAAGAELLVPDPTGAGKVSDLLPLLGLLINVPKGLQRALAQGVHPSLLDDLGLIRQQAHGTKAAAYEAPSAGRAMGNYGRGHYTTPLDAPSNTLGGQGGPMSNIYSAGDNPLGQHTRLDSAALRNPIVMPESGGTGRAPLRPSQEDIGLLRSWLEYADGIQSASPKPGSDGRAARAALEHLDELADQIAALGPDAAVSLGEWQNLEIAASQALYGLRLRGVEVPEVNASTMLSRAFGVDGVVAGDEVLSYDPVASVINGLESAIEHLRRLGYTDEQIQAADPIAWSMFQEGSSWSQPLARASMAPTAPPRYPVTELGEPVVPTREALTQLAEGDERAVSDWLRAWGVAEESIEDATLAAAFDSSYLADTLRKAYATIDDPDIAAELMAALDPPGAHTPLVTPNPRLYPERDLSNLRPSSFDEVRQGVEDTIRNLESGDDSWLGRGGGG